MQNIIKNAIAHLENNERGLLTQLVVFFMTDKIKINSFMCFVEITGICWTRDMFWACREKRKVRMCNHGTGERQGKTNRQDTDCVITGRGRDRARPIDTMLNSWTLWHEGIAVSEIIHCMRGKWL